MIQKQPLLMSAAQAAELIGVSKRTFHYLRKRADFPIKIMLGLRAVRWRRLEIEQWVAALPPVPETLPEPKQLAMARNRLHLRRAGDSAAR